MRNFLIMIVLLLLEAPAFAEDRLYTIDDAYASAFKSYESIKIAEEGVLQSESVVNQAWTYLYPRLTGDAAYTRYNEVLPPPSPSGTSSAGSQVFQPKDQVTASLRLLQPIYTGGRTMAALRSAEKLRDASKQDLSASQEALMLRVANAYYGVLKAQKLVEVSKDSLNRMERHRAVTEREANMRRTKANASALLRSNTLVSQARVILLRTEDSLRIARRQMNLLTGLPENAALSEPASIQPPAEGYEQLRDTALANREDYISAKLTRDIAEENITIVRGGHFPQLYAEGGLRYKNADPETIDAGTTYYGSVKLEVPIFEGGLMKHEVAEAKSKLRQAEFSTMLLQRSIEQEVYESYLDLQTTSTVLTVLRKQYDDAQSNFSNVESLYAEGLASSLQLIDAQQALLLAEREYVTAVYDQQVAILSLQRAIGILGKNPANTGKEGTHASS